MRVLCAAVTGPGHVYPVMAAARALAARGHEPVLAFESRFEHLAEREGMAFVPLPGVRSADPDAFKPYEISLAIARAFAPEVRRIRPDAALVDIITHGVALACEAAGVPFATLCPHPLPYPSKDLAPFGAARPPRRGAWGRRRDDRARARHLADLERGRDECNAIRGAMGLPALDRLDVAWSREAILVATPAALEPPRSDWPAHARVVGPCLYEPDGTAPAIPPGDGPLVLIAASTAHAGSVGAQAVRAVERLGVRAIMTTGASDAPPVRETGRVSVVAEAPHGALLAHADALVCNGGGGIVARGLAAGVPMVVLPNHGDQRENGYRVARSGAGVVARTPREIPRALARIVRRPSYRAAAQSIAAQAARSDGPATAAIAVESLQKQREAG
ncbi:MAG TPA: nucleotide disphospho-sugar-binding domain-containing protein [Actinomycetota bacterium]|nr:nucleotide disphospho-sugar-binding domain-containing protein [Actinomycetota bacterium]